MKKIPGTKLAVWSGEIYSLSHHHIRKPGKHDVFAYYDTAGNKRSATRAKLIWCADNGVEPWKVPEGYSFHLCDGEAVCETFSDRMSRVRKHPIATASWEDYDFIERFSHACKEHLKGDSTARVRIFQMLNSKREELIEHAKRTEGGVGEKRAIDLADQAILAVFDETVSGQRAIPSPVASMKSRIGWYIKNARMKKKQLSKLSTNDTSRI